MSHDRDALERYLDGQLDDEQRRQIERRLAEDPQLAQELAMQRRIDESLKRTFAAAAAPPLAVDAEAPPAHGAAQPAAAPRRPLVRRRVIVFALAAGLLLTIGLSLFTFTNIFTPVGIPPEDVGPPVAMDVLYRQTVEQGFQPQWLCETDNEFRRTFQYRLGQPLLTENLPPDVKMSGLAYRHVFSKNTVCVLMRVAGEPVMVFVDRKEAAALSGCDISDPSLHVFERELGRVRLIELTPHDKPAVIDRFVIPQRKKPPGS